MSANPKQAAGVLYSAAMFLVVSVLSGVLIAGLAVPFAGVAGVASRAAAEELQNLPADLETPPQAERSRVLLGNGKELTNFFDENRVYVPLEKIAPVMRTAQLAIEDHRFYEHGAMDPKATLRALLRNSAGGSTAGGSSITQQYVKMVQIERAALNNDPKGVQKAQESTYARKIQELRYAIALEKKLGPEAKDKILEGYLNIAYYGNGAYGVEAASHFYFNTTADKLTLSQAALLAGLVQNPDQVNPVRAKRAALERRDVVLNRMAELGLVSKEDADKAKSDDFDAKKVKHVRNGCEGSKYPFLCDYVKESLLNMPSLGKTRDERRALLYRGGLTIKTKIDVKTQDAAEKATAKYIDPKDPVISTTNIVEPGTGLILAMAQSRPEMGSKPGQTYYNYSVTPDMNGAEGYQAGSTFKAFTMAAALERGIPMNKRYNARNPMTFTGQTFESCNGPITLGKYKVGNSTGVNGPMDMRRAAMYSVNTYFIQLEQDAGLCNTVRMTEKLGVKLTTNKWDWDYYSNIASFTLGAVEVSPLSMAEAYATFAARGKHCDPHIVESVTNKSGKKLEVPDGDCQQVMAKEVADGVNQQLAAVMGGTGKRATIPGGFPQAGKTGTIENNQAVWFAGYTPEVAGVSMIAIDKQMSPFKKNKKGKAKRTGLKNYTLPESNTFLEGSGGGDAGAKIYTPAMKAALKGRPKTKFKKPPAEIVPRKTVDIPSVAGMSLAEAEAALRKAGFSVERTTVYSNAARGSFIGISPTGRAKEFTTIYLLISAGPKPKPKKETPKKETPKKDDEDEKKEEDTKKKEEDTKKKEEDKKKEEPKKPGGGSTPRWPR
ncbi:transglycosylase domain-containing protein [Propionibacteriaceae bacterium Y1700]|uniref:transglycosylase domain-containing protein n=1 Tax=Microlunatus sp. Y1700 TaxID=3418487 RepID=UPI003DA75BAB